MLSLSTALRALPEFSQLLGRLDTGPVALSGVGQVHKAHLAAAIHLLTGRQIFMLCQDELAAERMAADLAALTGEEVLNLPNRDFTFLDAESVSRGWEHKRLSALFAIKNAPIIVSAPEAVLRRTIPPDKLERASLRLKLGGQYKIEKLAESLVLADYKRCGQVEGEGQFAVRGGILDVFSPGMENPVRAEFFGDELDSMGYFDTSTQRRTENIDSAVILPSSETLIRLHDGGIEGLRADMEGLVKRLSRKKGSRDNLLASLQRDMERLDDSFPAADKYMALIYPELITPADYLPDSCVVIFCDHGNVEKQAEARLWQLGEDLDGLMEREIIAGELCDFACTWQQLVERLAGRSTVFLDSFTESSYPGQLRPKLYLNMLAKQLPSYGGSLETAVSDLKHYSDNGYSTVVLCGSEYRAKALKELLADHELTASLDYSLSSIPPVGVVSLSIGALSAGLEYPALKLAVLTEGQISGSAISKKKSAKKSKNRQALDSYADLSPGDFVVHEHHGIGRFVQIEKILVDGAERDYIKIAYSGSDVLYVPVTQLDLVSKYIGGGEEVAVKLNKLSGDAWTKAKARAKSAAKDLAKELIALYARRQKLEGYAFSPDCEWQSEFETAFEYIETDDQLRCIEEIKADMERSTPMDRLLCGDVGFGKTEVALRAVMKCILDGKQAAILAPTTVLVQQHYLATIKRFAGYPVKIDMLSRFRTAAQHKQTLRNLEGGSVDLIIGTHRLIQKDVKFKDLGLLIIDEEQRFGVGHKERLKEMATQVDVLTLTATPIPRTLNMALSGVRDMSTIEEPPRGRHPVQTYVLEHDWSIIGDAIRREISRGGQVYYLHNRIETIERCAAKIAELADGITVAVAHGKMGEQQLGPVMSGMAEGEIQVLVCTTIIETGIDIPNVNTLIIEDADKLGLAQLHQIRGRVGRSSRHAFSYLTFRRQKILTDVAQKRLSAIAEFAEFGSGFKIAMRDLEIRGAGNLLGAEQSGHLIDVGYDMYLKLLEEAVLEERGEAPEVKGECAVDIIISANIPDKYIPLPEHRMDLYRRIAHLRSRDEADDLIDELIDRFGEPPTSVITLTEIALLRAAAAAAGIKDIAQKNGNLIFKLANPRLEAVAMLCCEPAYKGKLLFSAGEEPYLTLRSPKGNLIAIASAFAAAYDAAGREAEAETISSQSGG